MNIKLLVEKSLKSGQFQLLPSQKRVCIPIIERIMKKMNAQIAFANIRIDGNVICDGHHRYIASILANYSLETVPCILPKATERISWIHLEYDDQDWDTPAKIVMLNQIDAEYNGLSLESIQKIIS